MRPRTLILAAALVPTVAAGQASEIATRSIAVNASAPQVCAVQEPELSSGAQVNFRGLNGTTLQIDRLVDPATLSTNAASVEISLAAVCNYPHRVVIESQNNGLWPTSGVVAAQPDGFGTAVPYRASVTWGIENVRLEADASVRRLGEASVRVDHAASGTILLRLEIQPGASNERQNAPLLAGYYGDTLRVTVEPQQ